MSREFSDYYHILCRGPSVCWAGKFRGDGVKRLTVDPKWNTNWNGCAGKAAMSCMTSAHAHTGGIE
jgi:hypothetical protein